MPHPADRFIKKSDGPLGITRSCTLCRWFAVTRKPPAGWRGRGWGMREGNKLRGLAIQHVKSVHPEALTPEIEPRERGSAGPSIEAEKHSDSMS